MNPGLGFKVGMAFRAGMGGRVPLPGLDPDEAGLLALVEGW